MLQYIVTKLVTIKNSFIIVLDKRLNYLKKFILMFYFSDFCKYLWCIILNKTNQSY